MPELMRWLIGLEPSSEEISGGSWRLEPASLPQGVWAIGASMLVVAAVVGIWILYRWEGRKLTLGIRLLLSTIRLVVLACVVFMLLEVVLVVTVHRPIPSQLLVLLDTSQSMGLSDPFTEESEAEDSRKHASGGRAGRTGSSVLREQRRLGLAGARTDHQFALRRAELSVYRFDSQLESLEEGDDRLTSLGTSGTHTAIGAALSDALATHRGQPISGVLLVTDGVSNTGSDPRRVATQAGKDGVTIHALAIGTDQGPSNATLADIEVSPVVFAGDPTEIAILYSSVALAGQPATIEVEVRREGGAWDELARHEVELGQDATLQRITVPFEPKKVGKHEFRARLADVGPELTEADNVRTRSIRVVRQTIRVLLVAGYPAPEVQFLRNALLRDAGMEFSSWVQSAGKGYEHIGHRPLRRLPADSKELDRYDVIVLFDPDMHALGPRWPEMLGKFVGTSGGGLIYVAGELNSRKLFNATGGGGDEGYLDTSWLRILPVSVDPGLYRSATEVRLSSQKIWNFELTSAGNRDSIFRFAPEESRNREVLASLPGMYWHFPVTRAKPGATILAQHGDPRMQNAFGRHVLMATQRYGPGRTMFLGFDSTYRWRYLHEEFFDGFWARLIDRAGRSKALGGRYPFTLATEKSVYSMGDRVVLQARMRSDEDPLAGVSELSGEVELPGGEILSLKWQPHAAQPDLLEASLQAQEAGSYSVRVFPAGGDLSTDTALRPASMNFEVEPPRQELDNPKLDRALLQDVTRASGGQLFTLVDHHEIPDAFTIRQVDRVLEFRDELWDAPLVFTTLIVLLTLEWVIRKRYRMA